MIINKKIHVCLVLIIAVNLLNFSINELKAAAQVNSTVKQNEFYLPKSSLSASKSSMTSKSVPVIKQNVKPGPVLKPKAKPEIKGKIIPPVKPQIKTTIISAKKTIISPAAKTGNKTNTLSNTTKPKAVSGNVVITPVISLSDYIRSYNASYANTFTSTLFGLSAAKAEILSFNSLEGKIYARLYNQKNLYVLIRPVNYQNTSVRITPSDGVYNISNTLIKQVFNNIKAELYTGKPAS